MPYVTEFGKTRDNGVTKTFSIKQTVVQKSQYL